VRALGSARQEDRLIPEGALVEIRPKLSSCSWTASQVRKSVSMVA
jgi:hypothetical protein